MKSDAIPGFICAFQFRDGGPAQALNGSEVAAALAGNGPWVWIHLNLADWRCRRWISDHLGVPADAVTAFAEPPQRQSIIAMAGLLCGHLADFRREFDYDSTEFCWLHFLAGDRFVLSGRVKAVQSAERMRTELARGSVFATPAIFLARLIANYPDTLDAALHRLMDELELIEDHVLSDRFRGERRRLMLARRETAHLHRHMRALRRALSHAERNIPDFPDGLAQTVARLSGLDQDFEAMEARARFFHDEIDAKLAAETNRQLYILSALTAAFLPPSLVAGVFGMNLKGMPWTDSPWGFWAAVGLAALSSGLVIMYLRMANKP